MCCQHLKIEILQIKTCRCINMYIPPDLRNKHAKIFSWKSDKPAPLGPYFLIATAILSWEWDRGFLSSEPQSPPLPTASHLPGFTHYIKPPIPCRNWAWELPRLIRSSWTPGSSLTSCVTLGKLLISLCLCLLACKTALKNQGEN